MKKFMAEKIKIKNPNKHMVGIRLMDGVRELAVPPGASILIDKDEVYFLNSFCKLFSKKHLVIEDNSINEELGYAVKTVDSFTDQEFETLLKGSISKIKKELEGIEEKHITDRVIAVAKNIDDIAQNKLKFLAEWSGYDLEQLINKDEK
jgi:hypothetical protein